MLTTTRTAANRSRKLLREAYVARAIPGLGVQPITLPRKPPESVRPATRFGVQTPTVATTDIQNATKPGLRFTFPESVTSISSGLIADTYANVLLCFLSVAAAHVFIIDQTEVETGLWKLARTTCVQLVSRDLGLVVVWGVLVSFFQQLLRPGKFAVSALEEWGRQVLAIAVSVLMLSSMTRLSHMAIDATVLLSAAPISVFGTTVRLACRKVSTRAGDRGHHEGKNVLIVGAGYMGVQMADYLARHRHHLRTVRGFLDNNDALDPRVLGGIEDLAEVARTQFIDEIIVPLPLQPEQVRTVVLEALRNHLDIRLVPELLEAYTSDMSIAVPVLPLHEEPIPEFGLLIKRALDVVLATVVLFAILPVLISISILIRIDSSGPVLYRAARVGKKGRKFLCWKFRTMVRDADGSKEPLRERNERTGPLFKVKKDPRITRVGAVLRRYSLDELPQLWNVIRGEMSLVGPRPHPVDDYQRYGLQDLRRLDVTPGITGLWQVRARRDPSFYRNMQLDLEYIECWSLWLDIKILVQTLGAVLMGTGA
jgi:exopolysaccharide biosynthesis polyprenyl glycosylphosphotransferase